MTLAVVPAHDEAGTVAEVVRAVSTLGLPVVVVDDGSGDATFAEARRAGAAVVRLPANLGVGAALRTGFRYAVARGHDRVIQVDADLQHDPASIPALLAAADDGAQLVIGSRFTAGGYRVPRLRRLVMRLLSSVVSRRVGQRIDDVTSGFRVVSQPLLGAFAEDYPAEYLGDTVEAIIMAHRLGSTITQVPVGMAPRGGGRGTPPLHAAAHVARTLMALLVRPRRSRRR
jgi:glycosyltransferase involved in cell wall biosynthesis